MKPRDLFQDRVFTTSNFLTILRVLVVPVIVWFMYCEHRTGDRFFMYCQIGGFSVIILSDFFDGLIARLLKQESRLGQLLDPVADKLSAFLMGIFLCIYKGFPLWFFIVFIIRELLILISAFFLFTRRDVVVEPNVIGKWCTGSIAFSAVVYILSIDHDVFGVALKDLSIYVILTLYILGGILSFRTYYRDCLEKKD